MLFLRRYSHSPHAVYRSKLFGKLYGRGDRLASTVSGSESYREIVGNSEKPGLHEKSEEIDTLWTSINEEFD